MQSNRQESINTISTGDRENASARSEAGQGRRVDSFL